MPLIVSTVPLVTTATVSQALELLDSALEVITALEQRKMTRERMHLTLNTKLLPDTTHRPALPSRSSVNLALSQPQQVKPPVLLARLVSIVILLEFPFQLIALKATIAKPELSIQLLAHQELTEIPLELLSFLSAQRAQQGSLAQTTPWNPSLTSVSLASIARKEP